MKYNSFSPDCYKLLSEQAFYASSSTITNNDQSNPLLLLSNMLSMMTVKLDYTNYVVWKHQIEVILETYSTIDAIDDSILAGGSQFFNLLLGWYIGLLCRPCLESEQI